MPHLYTDIVTAASACFHLNAAELFPKFVILHSLQKSAFAITTLSLFRLNYSACPTDDWQIAINLSSEDLMGLMGFIPRKPIARVDPDPLLSDPPVTDLPATGSPEVVDAGSPQDL